MKASDRWLQPNLLKMTHRLEEGSFQMQQHLSIKPQSTFATGYLIQSHYPEDNNVVANFTTSHACKFIWRFEERIVKQAFKMNVWVRSYQRPVMKWTKLSITQSLNVYNWPPTHFHASSEYFTLLQMKYPKLVSYCWMKPHTEFMGHHKRHIIKKTHHVKCSD